MSKLYRPAGLFIALVSATLLSGCATNTIRIERAGTMTDAARAATDATRVLMADVQAENRKALVDLVAADPNCRLPTPLIAQGATAGDEAICRKGNRQESDFQLTRLTRQDFGPSLAVIDGLVAYFDAVDAIITGEPVDLAGKLLDAQAQLDAIADNVGTLSGQEGGALPTLTEDQRAAVGDTLSLLSEIIDGAGRVDDLREMEIRLDQDAFANDIDRLSRINQRWLRVMDGQIDNRLTLVARYLPRIPVEDFEDRHRMATQQMTLIERQEALPELDIALARTVDMLRATHSDYYSLLFGDNQRLTVEEKRRAAAITRSRLRRALSHLGAIAGAF